LHQLVGVVIAVILLDVVDLLADNILRQAIARAVIGIVGVNGRLLPPAQNESKSHGKTERKIRKHTKENRCKISNNVVK
jgi:hypothetical protein